MYKYFPAMLYCVLFFLLLCISGCQVAGGGFVHYYPPKKIICDEPWVITIGFSISIADPEEKYGKLAERWKNITIHIRDSSDSNFLAVPMVIQDADPKTGKSYFKADMKPISCDPSIKYVEYYIDEMFDYHYNRTEIYKVPVGKD